MEVAKSIFEEVRRRNGTVHATVYPEERRALLSITIPSNQAEILKGKLAGWEAAGTRVVTGAGPISIGREIHYGEIPANTELAKAIQAALEKKKQLEQGAAGQESKPVFGPAQFTTTEMNLIRTLLGLPEAE